MSNLLIASLLICNNIVVDNIFDLGYGKQKVATNLPQASQFVDTFLGQDKNGPYILTWKNIVINTNSPLIVYVDNIRLIMSEYDIDTQKGEIIFKKTLKKNQVARIQYNYFSQYSIRNANPSQINTNNITFKSLGLKGLSLTALNPLNVSSSPDMVLSYNQKVGGLTANFLTDLNDLSNKNKGAVLLGYNVGNSANKLNLSYGKTKKGFSPYAKSFNLLESSEKMNIAANYSLDKNSKINISSNSFKNLNTLQTNQNNLAAIKFSPNNKFNIDYNYNNGDNTDVKNVRTVNDISSTSGKFDLGIAKLSFIDSKNTSIVNNVENTNNITNLNINTNNINFISKDEFKKDVKSGALNVKTDSLSFNSKLAGGNFVTNYSNVSSNVNGKLTETNNFNYGFNFLGNKSGFGGLKFNSSQSNGQNSMNENMLFQSSISQKNFQYSTNQNKTVLNNNEKVNLDDEKLIISANPTKSIPVLKYESIDDIKRNDKGILTGRSVDIASLKTVSNNNVFNYQYGNISNVISDDKKIDTLVNTANLSIPVGKGVFYSEFASNNILNNNINTKNEINKFAFNLQPSKNMPGVEFEKFGNALINNQSSSDNDTNKIKLTGKIGQFNIVTYKNSNSQDKDNLDVIDNSEHGVNLNLPGKVQLNLTQTTNDTIVNDEQKKILSLNFNANKNINFNIAQGMNQIINANGQAINSLSDNAYEVNYLKSATQLQTGYKTVTSFTDKTEIFKYRAKFGNSNSIANIDTMTEMRDSLTNSNLNDTSITKLSFNPAKNLSLVGSYELNPYDTAKPNVLIPIEKRTFGLNARLGNFTILGSYSDMENLPGTNPDVIAKNGGYNFISENAYKLHYRDHLYTEYKEQFFNGNTFKGNSIFTFGYNIKKNSNQSFAFSASSTKNYNAILKNNDIKADLTYSIRF